MGIRDEALQRTVTCDRTRRPRQAARTLRLSEVRIGPPLWVLASGGKGLPWFSEFWQESGGKTAFSL